jgi:hypothetical protein
MVGFLRSPAPPTYGSRLSIPRQHRADIYSCWGLFASMVNFLISPPFSAVQTMRSETVIDLLMDYQIKTGAVAGLV